MSNADLQKTIEAAWEARDTINTQTKGAVRDAVETALNLLDNGKLRVAEKVAGSNMGEWTVHQWLKKAVLLSFRLSDNDRFVTSIDPGHQVFGYERCH